MGRPLATGVVCALACAACSLTVDTSGLSTGNNPSVLPDGGPSSLPDGNATTNNPDGGSTINAPQVNVLIGVGGRSTCAVANNIISCWGDNDDGQLGDNSTSDRQSPTRIANQPPGTVKSISTCRSSSCAVIGDDVWCWGSASNGQLGKDGPTGGSLVPVRVPDLPGPALEVEVGNGFACSLLASGRVHCWGENDRGQLGDGTTSSHAGASAVLVEGGTFLEGAKTISIGDDHACALLASGDPYCWGHNDYNLLSKELPDDHATRATKIVGLPAGSPATFLSIGGWHTCAIVDGGLWCWGRGTEGELGNGKSDSVQPLQVNTMGAGSGTTFIEATGGNDDGDASCAIKNGELFCWGRSNDGRLGAGQTLNTNTPELVALPASPARVSGGYGHFCAVLANDALYCWGRGVEGQIGDGAGQSRPTPVLVTPLR